MFYMSDMSDVGLHRCQKTFAFKLATTFKETMKAVPFTVGKSDHIHIKK